MNKEQRLRIIEEETRQNLLKRESELDYIENKMKNVEMDNERQFKKTENMEYRLIDKSEEIQSLNLKIDQLLFDSRKKDELIEKLNMENERYVGKFDK